MRLHSTPNPIHVLLNYGPVEPHVEAGGGTLFQFATSLQIGHGDVVRSGHESIFSFLQKDLLEEFYGPQVLLRVHPFVGLRNRLSVELRIQKHFLNLHPPLERSSLYVIECRHPKIIDASQADVHMMPMKVLLNLQINHRIGWIPMILHRVLLGQIPEN